MHRLGMLSLTTLLFSANLSALPLSKVTAAENTETTVTQPQTSTTTPEALLQGATPTTSDSNPQLLNSEQNPVTTPEAQADLPGESVDSWMPNKKMQLIILENMKEQGIEATQTSDITKEKMAQLTSIHNLRWSGYQTTQSDKPGINSFSIEGIQYAVNITKLDLTSSLNYDGVVYGDITDISQIAALTKLEIIYLGGNRIKDIKPIVALQALGRLREVEVAYNAISDFSGIDTSKYEHFNYFSQILFLPPIYVDESRTASIDLSKIITLPDNETADQEFNTPDVFGKAALAPALTIPDDGSPSLAWAIFNGARGGHAEGYTLHYDKIVPQEAPGPADLGRPDISLVQLPYKNYLIGQLISKGTSSSATFTIAQPYVDTPLPSEPGIPSITTVTAHYQDEQGNTIAEDTTMRGAPGTVYIPSDAPNIPGYTFKEITGEAVGQFLEKPTEITYVYTKIPAPAQPITIHYKDEHGQTLAEDLVLTGNIGEAWQTVAKEIPGYHLKETIGVPEGVFSETAHTITFVYVIEDLSTDPGNGDGGTTTPEVPGTGDGDGSTTTPEVPGTGDGDGNTTTPEVPGTGNGDGSTTTPEVPGTGDGDGSTTEPETPGTGDGDGGTTTPEVPGTGDGDGSTTTPEVPGTGDGDGNTTEPETPGTGDGDGSTTTPETPGTGNGDGSTTTPEVPGTGSGDGSTTEPEVPGTGGGDGSTTTPETPGTGDGDGSTTTPEIPGTGDGDGSTTTPETPGTGDGDGSTTEPETPGTGGGDGSTTTPEVPGTGDGDGSTTTPETPGTGDGDGSTTTPETPGTGDGDGSTTTPEKPDTDGNGDSNTTGTGSTTDNIESDPIPTPGTSGNVTTTLPSHNFGNGSSTGSPTTSTGPASAGLSTSASYRNPLRYVSGRASVKAGDTLPQTGEKQNHGLMILGLSLTSLVALTCGYLFKKRKHKA